MTKTEKISNFFKTTNFKSILTDWVYLTLGSIALILSIDIFLAPSRLSPGGVAGIAIIINEYTGWPIGSLMLLLNVPMLFLGFGYLGRFRFLVSTVYVVLFYNLGVDYAAQFLPAGITDDLLLNALYSAIVGGIGSGLIYRGRGTVAGTGILSRVIQLKTGMPISQIYLFIDGGVILAAGLVFNWEIALYSLMTLFVWGVVTDYVLEGPSVIRTAFIVTDHPQAVSRAVMQRMKLGITGWQGQGMFTERQHTVLFCTVSRPDVNGLKSLVAQVDPQAFVVIGQGHQARGGVLRQAQEPQAAASPAEKLTPAVETAG